MLINKMSLDKAKESALNSQNVTIDSELYLEGEDWGNNGEIGTMDDWEEEIPENEESARATGFYDWYESDDDYNSWDEYRCHLLGQLRAVEIIGGDRDDITTIAERVAEIFGNDGQVWDTMDPNGNTICLQDVCDSHCADTEYSAREYDENNNLIYVRVHESGHLAGDPVRHVFPDGSAIVEAGDTWDIEGSIPFSWKGAE